jgi:hypothetical protein
MLLHKIERVDNVELLYRFSQFSDIEIFKPASKHATRGSFYLIAKNIQPNAGPAKEAVVYWKKAWWYATFGREAGLGAKRLKFDDEYVQEIFDSFGDKFTKLARPIWSVQAKALEGASWNKSKTMW